MANAGRILILPKGEYDASATYEMLDMVGYSNTSWLAKKTVAGIEPSNTNSEYWQELFNFKYENAKVVHVNGVEGSLFGFKNTMHKKLAGQVEIAPTETTTSLLIGQLNPDFSPSYTVPFIAYNNSRGSYCGGRIETDGKIYLEILNDAINRGNSYRINVSY